jgi:uncharacterized membrane protein YhaH (DUF805 family)
MEWYLKVVKNYVGFSGRAQRKEYWMFVLISALIVLGIDIIGPVLLGATLADLVSGLYSLGILLPSLAVGVRRLHDSGRSGWWLLIIFVPIIGILVLIFFLVQDSEAGQNAYGPNPKGVQAEAAATETATPASAAPTAATTAENTPQVNVPVETPTENEPPTQQQ